jgi:ribosome-binding protein aMBF1 (putative translation factor)
MSHQDWNTIVIHSKTQKSAPKEIQSKTGDNSKKDAERKLENDNAEQFKHTTIPKTLSAEITKARISLQKTQKEFASMLEVKLPVYVEIENSKAIYNADTKKLVNKIENKFKIKFLNK